MKKRIILITILFSFIPILIRGYKAFEYYDYQSIRYEKYINIQDNIEKTDAEIIEKNTIKEQIKISNEEKIKLLELWKKRLEKIKK